ncbi:MAG: LPXTG cell wall anchor domain-containing protein [Clostridiales bacterium]|nr:LPXTG cell wall anchor domain-containing protein [Clostridiales bacterium]
MKKRIMALLCVMIMVVGMSVCTMAAVSPTGSSDTTTTTTKTTTAPKTGESNILLYGIAAAAVLAGTAAVSKKHLEEL